MRLRFFLSAFFFIFIGLAPVVSAEQGFQTTADGIRIFYDRRQAEKEVGSVILLHGWNASHKEWEDFVPFLNLNGWSTVAIDIRGHGVSKQRQGGSIDAGTMGAQDHRNIFFDIEAVRPLVEKSKKIWIIGSSYGAAMAFKYSLENSWVSGVVLLSPAIRYSRKGYKREMEKYGERPIFFAAAKKDKVSYKTAKKLNRKARGESRLKKYKGAAHGAAGLLALDSKLQVEILKWLNERF